MYIYTHVCVVTIVMYWGCSTPGGGGPRELPPRDNNNDDVHMIACDLLRLSWKCIDVQWFLVAKARVDSTLGIQTSKTAKTNNMSKKALSPCRVTITMMYYYY